MLLVAAVIFLGATWFKTSLYHNYLSDPILLVIPVIAVLALLATKLLIMKKTWWKAWFSSCLTIFTVTMFGVIGLYPNLLPSSIDPAFSLTAFNSSSSQLTLTIMLVVALIFVPLVILYQAWGYYLFREKLTEEHLASEEAY